jgi:hypothetical protein
LAVQAKYDEAGRARRTAESNAAALKSQSKVGAPVSGEREREREREREGEGERERCREMAITVQYVSHISSPVLWMDNCVP